MAVQGINYNKVQPLRVNEINSKGNILNNIKYKMENFNAQTKKDNSYCSNSFCSERIINYLI